MEENMKTAIVVDDNPELIQVFVELLTLRKIHVIGTANNGYQGVELYKYLKPDITFLDVVMPNTDGFYALQRIREINPEAIVIMVTTDLSEETTRKLNELKATSIVYKPFSIDELVKIVTEVTSRNLKQTKFFN